MAVSDKKSFFTDCHRIKNNLAAGSPLQESNRRPATFLKGGIFPQGNGFPYLVVHFRVQLK